MEGVIVLGYSNQIINFAKQTVELNYMPKFIFSTSDGSRDNVISQVYSSLKENYLSASLQLYQGQVT